jgi:hypothetical protein
MADQPHFSDVAAYRPTPDEGITPWVLKRARVYLAALVISTVAFLLIASWLYGDSSDAARLVHLAGSALMGAAAAFGLWRGHHPRTPL